MIDTATYRKLLSLQQQRCELAWLARRVSHPLGDWQCRPNPYASRKGETAHLTRPMTLATETMPTEAM